MTAIGLRNRVVYPFRLKHNCLATEDTELYEGKDEHFIHYRTGQSSLP